MVEDLIRHQPPPPRPRFPKLNSAEVRLIYDGVGDTLIVRLTAPGPATSLDVDGEFWLRMNPSSGDVYGIEVEGFEAGYLKRHPDVTQLWIEAGGRDGAELRPESRLALVKRILASAPSLGHSGDTAAG